MEPITIKKQKVENGRLQELSKFGKLANVVYTIETSQTLELETIMALHRSVCEHFKSTEGHSVHSFRLYILESLMEWFSEQIQTMNESIMNGDIVEAYSNAWKSYYFRAVVTNVVFSHLNYCASIKVQEHEKQDAVLKIALRIWRNEVFDHFKENLVTVVLELIRNERSGKTINEEAVKTIVSSFVSIDSNTGLSVALGTYERYFEVNYIQDLREFYLKECTDYLNDKKNSALDFIKKVEERLLDEETRAKKYLHSSSLGWQKFECQEILIRRNLDVIYSEFERLLEAEKREDILRTYSVVSQLDGALGEMGEMFRVHVAAAVNAKFEQLDKSLFNPIVFVRSILDAYKKYTTLVQECFNADPVFKAGLGKACKDFVNNNVGGQEASHSKFKSSELLARYCDQLLKKSCTTENEQEVEEKLNQMMTIFKFLEDKDAFKKYYSVKLANRLTQQFCTSDAELAMITKLKEFCGFEYTSKLLRMYQDVHLSRELNEEFRKSPQFQQDPKLSLDFQILILSARSWPFTHCGSSFTPPVEIESSIQAFHKFYTAKHNGQKLNWLYGRSKGEIIYNRPLAKFYIQATAYQITVLLLFNSNDEYQLSEILEITKLDPEVLKQVIKSLAKFNLCKCSGELDADSLIKLNMDYQNTNSCVKINGPLRNDVKKEIEKSDKAVEEDRNLRIQAAIVRIMKMRKVIGHQELLAEVMKQMNSQFKATVLSIKKCIDILIHKDYMKRDDAQKDMYSYVA